MAGVDDLTLGQVRRELTRLVSLAGSATLPKPTRINPPDHEMPGAEWEISQHTIIPFAKVPSWFVRAVDDSETCDAVYISSPDSVYPAEDFTAMPTGDARRLAMAILAAADRADHRALRVPRLDDQRNKS
jgi:hypothetical protein